MSFPRTSLQTALHRFLGVERWRALGEALKAETQLCPVPKQGSWAVLGSTLVALLPLPFIYLNSVQPSATQLDLPLLVIGVTTLVAILLRGRMQLYYNRVTTWREAFSLTHTAFALGCIPAVLILFFSPELFSQQQQFVQEKLVTKAPQQISQTMLILQTLLTFLLVALWASVTEEIIYRGLLVSVVRRWDLGMAQKYKDILACVLGGSIFGLAHLPTWGPIAALALVGLGIGFSLGYIANGEKLMPLIVYHFLFDMISMCVSSLGVFR